MSQLYVDYGSLVRNLHQIAAGKRIPVNGTFEITERCNLACRMCYICQKPDHAHLKSHELTADQWLEVAVQAKNNGMVFLLITGGEPFVRPDFFQIYSPLAEMGFQMILFTNGTLITDSVAARLAESPPHRTEITLYGATATTYESITRTPGSYKRCCEGIDALVKHNIPLGLKTTVTQQNVHELSMMREFAKNRGLSFTAGWLLTPRIDGSPSEVVDCRLSPTECVKLEATDQASAHEWVEAALRASAGDTDKNFYCFAGIVAFVVSAQGEMRPCIDLRCPGVNPLKSGFKAAWERINAFVDSGPPMHQTCRNCTARTWCPRCPAWSMLETGTLTEPVSYLCEIAFARKKKYAPNT